MKNATVVLTIGHNVCGIEQFTIAEVCKFAAEYLEIEAFTAYECRGMWRGECEKSTRIEICALSENDAREIRARVPVLALAMNQQAIMCEIRPDRVEFVERLQIAAAV